MTGIGIAAMLLRRRAPSHRRSRCPWRWRWRRRRKRRRLAVVTEEALAAATSAASAVVLGASAAVISVGASAVVSGALVPHRRTGHFRPRDRRGTRGSFIRRVAYWRGGQRSASAHRQPCGRLGGAAQRNRQPICRHRPHLWTCRVGARPRNGPRGLRQSRHRQRGLAIALRIGPVPRAILWFALAVVARRSRRWLDWTGVLAIRLL